MLSRGFFYFSVGVGAFVIGMSQISSFFSCYSSDTIFSQTENPDESFCELCCARNITGICYRSNPL